MNYLNDAKNRIQIVELILLFAYLCPAASSNAVCLRCDSIPHPRDCDRAVQCNTDELCYVEQVVTESGNVVYNSGCSSQQKCLAGKTKRNSVSYSRDINEQINSFDDIKVNDENSVDEVSVYGTAEDDIVTCFDCCNSTRYCNRDLCDFGSQVSHPNQTYCLSCSDVVSPSGCEYLVLCNPGEICYTEFLNLNGEERYRLGCVSQMACAKSKPAASGPAFVGRKRFFMQGVSMEKYCSKCCDDNVGNCNRELCGSGSDLTGIDLYELVNPPERHDFCTDLFPDACPILILQNPDLCKEPRYSHYACREYCGTCVNPGHITARPTITSPTPTATAVTTPGVPDTDCFYESTKYMGAFTTTVTGKTCLNWVDVNPSIKGIADATIRTASNKCRDPEGIGFPWCYTSKSFDREFCPVPFCQECFFPNKSADYEGHVSTDIDNSTCLPWTDYLSKTGNPFRNATVVAELKNHCRDLFRSGTPQCYNGATLKNCDIPVCSHDCQDNPETNCTLIKQYVCPYEYASVTLCPKTCNKCKFGLMPPKTIQPPKDKCVDNPDASCETLQFVICGDPDGALKLCPKTCGVCSQLYGKTTINPSTSQVTTTSTIVTTPATIFATKSSTTTPTTQPPPYWLPWGQWTCEFQQGACFQRRDRNCSTGLDSDCKNGPGGNQYAIGLCTNTSCPDQLFTKTTNTPSTSQVTTPLTTVTTPTTTPTTPTSPPPPYWLPWGQWTCDLQQEACFQKRYRNCSTGSYSDCRNGHGGNQYEVAICTSTSCPGYVTPTQTAMPTTTPLAACHDNPGTAGCANPDLLIELCQETQLAWEFCPASCNLCDTCWDYLNCSITGAEKLFCSREQFALQYCRKTCGKCDHKPVHVQKNKCGDPVANEFICETLQTELCICNDPSVRALCGKYCDNQCKDHPFAGSNCTPDTRRKRDEVLHRYLSL